jgi:hypothetical protein
MKIQEAYRQLDLANGLDFDRVQSQYTTLKSGLAEKISGTSNAVLKEVYQKRLNEVEEAFTVLAKHFNHDVNDEVLAILSVAFGLTAQAQYYHLSGASSRS